MESPLLGCSPWACSLSPILCLMPSESSGGHSPVATTKLSEKQVGEDHGSSHCGLWKHLQTCPCVNTPLAHCHVLVGQRVEGACVLCVRAPPALARMHHDGVKLGFILVMTSAPLHAYVHEDRRVPSGRC